MAHKSIIHVQVQYYWEDYVPVQVSWAHLCVSCHSAGCDNIAELLRTYTEYSFRVTIIYIYTSDLLSYYFYGV